MRKVRKCFCFAWRIKRNEKNCLEGKLSGQKTNDKNERHWTVEILSALETGKPLGQEGLK